MPPKVEIFAWFVLIGRVNTKTRLHRLGIIQGDQVCCVLCSKEEESMEHLFFNCEFAWKLWSYWLKKWNVCWVSPKDQKSFYE